MKKELLLLSLCYICAYAWYPKFPLYKQCDPKWANETMGVPNHAGDNTICNEGCAMSSLAMALAGFQIHVGGKLTTPQTLNQWLRENNGYHCIGSDCANLVLNAPEAIAPKRIKCLGEPQTPFWVTLRRFIEEGLIILAHVRNQHHFVLVDGIDHTQHETVTVLDPFYNSTTYTYAEIHDVILYDIL